MDAGRDAGRGRRAGAWVIDGLVAALVLALLGLPFAATLAANQAAPSPAPVALTLPPLVRTVTAPLRDVPIVSAGGPVAAAIDDGRVLTDVTAMRAALASAAADAFGDADAGGLWSVVALDYPDFYSDVAEDTYPYHYPVLEPVLDQLPPSPPSPPSPGPAGAASANDLAALLVLAAAHYPPDAFPDLANAAAAHTRFLTGYAGAPPPARGS